MFRAGYAGDGERTEKWDPQTGNHVYSFGLHDTKGNTVITPGLAEQSGANAQFYHHDWRGSTRFMTDNVGTKLSDNIRFDGYGNRTAGTGAVNATDYQFAGAHGYQREPAGGAELGLDYLYQRYYDPAIGRFISRDPIGYDGGLNLYGYCENDPVNSVDPTGLISRREAMNRAKDTAGIPRSAKPVDQWTVGADQARARGKSYRLSSDTGSHGRYWKYITDGGQERVVVEHLNDGVPHFHAGKPKGEQVQGVRRNVDFRVERYSKLTPVGTNDHHIPYESSPRPCPNARSGALGGVGRAGRALGTLSRAAGRMSMFMIFWDAIFGPERERREQEEWFQKNGYKPYRDWMGNLHYPPI